jgi:hypothetical protein
VLLELFISARSFSAGANIVQGRGLPGWGRVLLEACVAGLARLADLQELEMMDTKITSLPTWPFDIQVVSRLIAIVLSVTAVLLARLVTNFLHI